MSPFWYWYKTGIILWKPKDVKSVGHAKIIAGIEINLLIVLSMSKTFIIVIIQKK